MHVRVHGKAVRSIGPKGGSEQETDYQSQSDQQGTNAGCETKPKNQVGPALCRDLLAHIPRIAEERGNFKSERHVRIGGPTARAGTPEGVRGRANWKIGPPSPKFVPVRW